MTIHRLAALFLLTGLLAGCDGDKKQKTVKFTNIRPLVSRAMRLEVVATPDDGGYQLHITDRASYHLQRGISPNELGELHCYLLEWLPSELYGNSIHYGGPINHTFDSGNTAPLVGVKIKDDVLVGYFVAPQGDFLPKQGWTRVDTVGYVSLANDRQPKATPCKLQELKSEASGEYRLKDSLDASFILIPADPGPTISSSDAGLLDSVDFYYAANLRLRGGGRKPSEFTGQMDLGH